MTEEEPLKYQSLLAIRARKAQLNKDIQRSEQEIKATWNSIFHPKKAPTPKTPTQRLVALASRNNQIKTIRITASEKSGTVFLGKIGKKIPLLRK